MVRAHSTLAAANTYTGATTINAGTLSLGVANAVGPSSALTVAAGATFDLAGFSRHGRLARRRRQRDQLGGRRGDARHRRPQHINDLLGRHEPMAAARSA